MDENESIEEEMSLDGVSCFLSFTLFDNNDLHFDCNWVKEDDVVKMAALINAIIKTDFIKDNIEKMDTTDKEGQKLLLTMFKSKKYITPLEAGGLNAS